MNAATQHAVSLMNKYNQLVAALDDAWGNAHQIQAINDEMKYLETSIISIMGIGWFESNAEI
jgi:hypothetical protein